MFDVSSLSRIECELLRAAAANRGQLQVVMRSNTNGRAVVAGKKVFTDPADREVAQRYLAELPRLQEKQLARQSGSRNTYELTNAGWELSRKLPRQ